jgi:hypothetical protein
VGSRKIKRPGDLASRVRGADRLSYDCLAG